MMCRGRFDSSGLRGAARFLGVESWHVSQA